MEFIQCNSANYQSGRSKPIQYIVVHYTSNNGDTAKNNCDYFHNNVVKASAHYFVDENTIMQSVKDSDTAWHCGGGLQGSGGHTFYQKCENSNSIAIEMCNFTAYNGKVANNAIEFIREKMTEYDVPIDRVIRHYDVTGKQCPAPLLDEGAWAEFKQKIESEELTMNQYEELKALLDPIIPKYAEIDENIPYGLQAEIREAVDMGIVSYGEHGFEPALSAMDVRHIVFAKRARAGDVREGSGERVS